MDLQQHDKYHGGAVLWSPRKLQEARYRERTKQDEAAELQLQKARDREAREASRVLQQELAAQAKAARQRAAEERREAKKIQAEVLAAQRELKKQQREAATTQKALDIQNKRTRTSSHSAAKNPSKRRRVMSGASQRVVAPELPQKPPQKTRTRLIQAPKRLAE